jgi:hypothetical protein
MTGKVTLTAAADGGCHCGAVRYRVEPCVGDSAYCHCRMCQKTAGAPALAWMSIPREAFRFTNGAPKVFRSGPTSQREFCGDCGTQLLYRRDASATVDINTVTLDDPAIAPPQYHIWRMSRIAWFETTDALPRCDDQGPDHF